ncbi:MBL fold metallo-hydrolase [Glycomyces sp. NPDC047010]|uniref:MBL fold metallo-hydrolase n=1 Tax=Glycomyces sp. NPDC047010 TaxID=3155023 RepID=UPI003404AFD4
MNESENPVVAVTRVANACTLIEIGGRRILTDPWFTERWYLRRGEPLGLRIEEVPPVDAVVVTSFAANHWDLRALRAYPHKATTPVLTAADFMARRTRGLGYPRAERIDWGTVRELGDGLSIEAAPAGRLMRWRHNAYVISAGGRRVYFGGEIRDVALLREYRAHRPAVDVALLPTNGLAPVVGPPLVMGHREAVEGAKALGAKALVAVHDAHAHDPMSLVFRRHGSAAEAERLAAPGLDVVVLPPGRRWTLA